jgi:NAD(P)-dependent dehydrogenase (short-subunit alcohol dehydrogenase family)
MTRASRQKVLRTLGAGAAVAAGVALAAIGRAVVRARRRLHLRGRVAIVTGGTRGLGLLIAEELGRRGMKVAICGRTPEAVVEAAERLRRRGVPVIAWACDLGERAQADAFVERVALAWGRIDVLVNNAGVIHVEPAQSLTLDGLEEVMRSNFWSAANMTFAALPFLMEHPGRARIGNVTSLGGRIAVPHLLGYSVSKFAMLGLSEGLAAELHRSGVLVTSILPSVMRTGSHQNAEYAGDPEREMEWFSLGMRPLLSVDAHRAALRIVDAIEHGDPLLHVGVASAVATRLHGLAPRLFTELMRVVNRALPAPDDHPKAARRGRDIDTPLQGSKRLEAADQAARENNEAPPLHARHARHNGLGAA